MIVNTSLEIIISMTIGAFSAQLFKFLTYYIKHRKLNFKTLVSTGGMPSSHSSFATSLTTSVGLISGFYSPDFAIALGFAMVVMYDAAGLRRSAGKMAAILNCVVEDFYTDRHTKKSHERLIELLGHTPFEVLIGAILGIFTAYSVHGILLG